MRAVETAIDESIVGQSDVAPRRLILRNNALTIVRLITRQTDDAFGIVHLRIRRDDPIVGDDIVVIGRAHRAGYPSQFT